VLILDEPTALLAPSEVAELLAVMRRLATAGMALVFITHRLRDALAVADRITVLQQGRTVLSRETTSVSEIDVTAAMFPADVPLDVGRPSAHTRRDRIASLDNVDVQDESGRVRLRSATLEVYGGEIIGVAGVEGSGYHELLGALGGRLVTNRGSAQRPDRVAFIPEHRLRDALIPAFSLTENVALRESGARRGRMKWNELTPESEELVASFGIRAASVDSPAFTLSGGNQQKLVLARELGANPSLVVAENPTQGLDLRASASIRAHLRAARDAGAAVVLYSSDLEELLALADRIVVTFNGTMVEVPVDAEAVGRQMIGA
jgi:simple sugar transport system ATP-binding protein